ncbi:MAG: TrpB-like pyridoxal-phosphate dependent enzyme [Gemmatimonadaceae bacterium 4484_173]|nr:MAG: TrpB-like pyridoxal-phosphate dependent enzyme [Gemmatimonadaceae bacterium 4484_173]
MRRFSSRSSSFLPEEYTNLKPFLPSLPPPPIGPDGTPVSPDVLAALFPSGMIQHEITMEARVPIPEEVRDAYKVYRPSPLVRAVELERKLDTPAHIYYKYEGTNPAGSHKSNTALPQAFFAAKDGLTGITTETGAGQWGSALSQACNRFGLDLEVFMVRASFLQKPLRQTFINMHGGTVHASPSDRTESGRSFLEQDPNHPGSLGIAISEAVEVVLKEKKSCYSLGSVSDAVCLHQSIIGQESIKQMEEMGEYPTHIIACVGGGSNFAGIAFPFMEKVLTGGDKIDFTAVEPTVCPTLTEGKLKYDFGDASGLTPKYMMYSLGAGFVPPPIHAGGLRYHGMAPLVSHLVKLGLVNPISFKQNKILAAGKEFTRVEGILPAPESAHAIAAVMDSALEAKQKGEKRVILFNLSGHGFLDLAAYEND